MNKKQLKQVMLEVLDGFNDYNKDEWYVTDREVAEFGIKALAEQLNIDLTEELEQQKKSHNSVNCCSIKVGSEMRYANSLHIRTVRS